MDTQTAVVLICAIVVVALLTWMFARRRRSHDLKSQFGPEYDREVNELGSRHKAESELRHRARRVEKLPIRPLPPTERMRYAEMWNHQQARFVDDPAGAVDAADHLVEEVMSKRGYPVGDFDQNAADISVDHPHVVENYRTAHDIARRVDRGSVGTEDLRRAMVCFRALFEELLDDRLSGATA